MKVSELQAGDILWLYNSYEDYFAEFEFVQINDDGTSRFRITGEVSIDEPDYGYTVSSLEFRNDMNTRGHKKIRVISTKGFSYKFLRLKEQFKTYFKGFSSCIKCF